MLFGCSDSYLVDNGVNFSEGKPCGMVRMADLSSTGIYAINGFAKHGEKLVMGFVYATRGGVCSGFVVTPYESVADDGNVCG